MDPGLRTFSDSATFVTEAAIGFSAGFSAPCLTNNPEDFPLDQISFLLGKEPQGSLVHVMCQVISVKGRGVH